MSLVVRLTKVGRKGESKFRVIVTEKRSRRDGKPVEALGWFEKTTKGYKSKINKQRYNYWLSNGAKPSETVSKLLKS